MAGTRGTGLSPSGSSIIPSGGGIALVQSASQSVADGSAGCQADFVGCLVTGIGAGSYTQRGTLNGVPYYNLDGQPNDPNHFSVAKGLDDSASWYITDDATFPANVINASSGIDASLPYLDSWTGSTVSPVTIPCTAGDQVIVGISYDSSAGFTTAPTFVGGGASALDLIPGTEVTNAGLTTAIYRGTATGGETGVTMTMDAAVRCSMQVMEWSGVSSAAAEDASTGMGTESSNVNLDPALTPVSANNLLLATVACDVDTTIESSAGWSGLGSTIGSTIGGANVWQQSFYWIQTDATPQDFTATFGTDVTSAACGAALGGA